MRTPSGYRPPVPRRSQNRDGRRRGPLHREPSPAAGAASGPAPGQGSPDAERCLPSPMTSPHRGRTHSRHGTAALPGRDRYPATSATMLHPARPARICTERGNADILFGDDCAAALDSVPVSDGASAAPAPGSRREDDAVGPSGCPARRRSAWASSMTGVVVALPCFRESWSAARARHRCAGLHSPPCLRRAALRSHPQRSAEGAPAGDQQGSAVHGAEAWALGISSGGAPPLPGHGGPQLLRAHQPQRLDRHLPH
jgi:hypothetical protein